MKSFILGMIVGVIGFLVFCNAFNIIYDNATAHYMPNGWDSKAYDQKKKDYPIASKINSWLKMPSIGFFDPLTERCTKDKRGDRTRREYFKCNAVQIFISDLIYGEITKKNK